MIDAQDRMPGSLLVRMRRPLVGITGLALIAMGWRSEWAVALGSGLLLGVFVVDCLDRWQWINLSTNRGTSSLLTWIPLGGFGLALALRVGWLGFVSLGLLAVFRIELSYAHWRGTPGD